MLEIASTQGLLDHDTSQAVLIIWTAPSAPLIFYPQQFIWSSVCTHTPHKKSFFPQSQCAWLGASAWLAVMIQRQRDRMTHTGKEDRLGQKGGSPQEWQQKHIGGG